MAPSALAVVGALLLTGCGADGTPETPEPDVSVTAAAEPVQVEAPDVVGLRLDEARDVLREAGVAVVEEVDVDEGKAVLMASNWTVVDQEQDTDGVRLGVSKRSGDLEQDDASEVSDDERSAQLEADIKAALGVESFGELLASDPSLWGGWINGVRVEGSKATITLQVAADDPLRDDLGERAARALPTLLPPESLADISWIVVEDASGVVIAQEMT